MLLTHLLPSPWQNCPPGFTFIDTLPASPCDMLSLVSSLFQNKNGRLFQERRCDLKTNSIGSKVDSFWMMWPVILQRLEIIRPESILLRIIKPRRVADSSVALFSSFNEIWHGWVTRGVINPTIQFHYARIDTFSFLDNAVYNEIVNIEFNRHFGNRSLSELNPGNAIICVMNSLRASFFSVRRLKAFAAAKNYQPLADEATNFFRRGTAPIWSEWVWVNTMYLFSPAQYPILQSGER